MSDLTINAAFDGGNIRVVGIEGDRVDLEIVNDHQSDFYQWFYFRAGGVKGRTLTFRILNGAGSAYPFGWPGYHVRASTDRRDWRMTPTHYADGVIEWKWAGETDLVWFAYFEPYTMERHHDRGDTMVAAASVSTGKDGKDTPVGIFPILQKREMHHSNLYDSAPMPFMQRLTWDGVALHAGKNPGFPDSHGCIRLPAAFAKKLFSITSVGTNVVVTDQMVGDHFDPALLQTDAMQANQAQLASLDR